MKPELQAFYADSGAERVGFLMRDGSLVEVENLAQDPSNSFEVDVAFLIENEDSMVASFHTHPGSPANLSGEDYQSFANWPGLLHYIVGNDGVRCFEVRKNGAVVERN